MAMLGGEGHQQEQRPVWVRVALAPVQHVLVPVLAPMLLTAIVIGLVVTRDVEPSGVDQPATGLVPGAATVTQWDRDRSLLPDGFGVARDPGYDSPQALVDALITAATDGGEAPSWVDGWIVSEEDDSATARVIVPSSAPGDQYLATEFLLDLTGTLTGWRVRVTHVRHHCAAEVLDVFFCAA